MIITTNIRHIFKFGQISTKITFKKYNLLLQVLDLGHDIKFLCVSSGHVSTRFTMFKFIELEIIVLNIFFNDFRTLRGAFPETYSFRYCG